MSQKKTDKELIEAMKHGSVEAYEALFLRYYPALLRFMSGMLKDRIAEDLCQNIFMRVWLQRESFDSDMGIRNWLFTVAKNDIINWFKSKKYRSTVLCSEVPDSEDRHTAVDEIFNTEEMRSIVNKSIDDMPSQRRLIFRLSREKNMSNKQIAEFLNLSVRTVEKHLELALKDIRRTLN